MVKQQFRRPERDIFEQRVPFGHDERENLAIYEHLREEAMCASERHFVRRLWRQFTALDLHDHGFVKRFPFDCPSRIWEMYLAWVFHLWGWKLTPSKTRGVGPDFGVRGLGPTEDSMMWVEAIAPTRGDDANLVGFHPAGPGGIQMTTGGELRRTQSLRLASSMDAKIAKHAEWLQKGHVATGDGYVIAISGSRWDNTANMLDTVGEPPVVVRYLFGFGSSTFNVELGGERRVTSGPFRPAPRIQKRIESGGAVEIDAGPFATGACPQVSAVFFCPNHVKNRSTRVGSDLIVVHNPHAKIPFPRGRLRRGQEWWAEAAHDGMSLQYHEYGPKDER
jgi:hypothetical protein